MSAELKTRLVFIDTEVFRSKNFQFGEYTLGKLEEHLEYERLHLLLSIITVNEIKSQIRERSNDAYNKLKAFQKDAMFLRNAPDLPCYQAFQKVTSDQIYEKAIGRFESFLRNARVEVVSFDGVEIEEIFERYFSSEAPFGSGKKKSEFPDAFAIEAVAKAAEKRHHELYVISNDGDLKKYSEKKENLHHLETIEELLELVVHAEVLLAEPAKIGDQFIKEHADDIKLVITEEMQKSEFYSSGDEGLEFEVSDVKIKSVAIEGYKILSATRDEATYEVEFSAEISAELAYSDYENSPWDPEEHDYVFIVQRYFRRMHSENYICFLTINFHDGLARNAEIAEITFESSSFELNDIDGEVADADY